MAKIIAVDGPSGAGKSSICKAVARELNYSYVDTGAIYRSIALIVYRELFSESLNLDNMRKLIEQNLSEILDIVKRKKIGMSFSSEGLKVLLDDEDISQLIRTENISLLSSVVSGFKEIRASLMDIQRSLALNTDKYASIIDGRDIGTVVFPNADLKVYLTASAEERAKRRYKELLSKGIKADYDEVLKNIEQRDYNDKNRSIAPLKKATDAIELNTGGLDFDEVKAKFIGIIREKLEE